MVFANLPRDTMHKGYMMLSIAKGGHSVPSVQCSPLRVLHSLLRRRLCVHGYDNPCIRCMVTLLSPFQSFIGSFPGIARSMDTILDTNTWFLTIVPLIHSMYVPCTFVLKSFVSSPVCMGMLMHGPTSPLAAVFWQFVNQSYNVLNNYTNRAGATVDFTELMKSYGLAVGVSGGIAFGECR